MGMRRQRTFYSKPFPNSPMLFASTRFFLFLFGTLALLAIIPKPIAKRRALAVASCFFYAAWDWRYLGLLLAVA